MFSYSSKVKKGSVLFTTILFISLIFTIALAMMAFAMQKSKNIQYASHKILKVDEALEARENLLYSISKKFSEFTTESDEEKLRLLKESLKEKLYYGNSYVVYTNNDPPIEMDLRIGNDILTEYYECSVENGKLVLKRKYVHNNKKL